ncbi:unnamed protein product [Mytilus coruscus]|uniref:Peptidase A2 domain-containing protein n=1 Tax=Mytilus coruscus TaxID=42192 RepID=A0A6J8BT98_MYTCO|nr:unnamed protein product [Mytilus coruscus]
MDRGEPKRITIVTETRNLRSQPFIASDDQISTGKQWEEWLENKKDALIIYGGKDIARLERSLRNKEGEDEYKILKNKLNKYYMPKRNKHHARYLFLKMKPLRDENTVTYVTRLREKAHACEFEATCEERILEHCIQTITNQELKKRAISKGWNLDKFVEEAGQIEDTCLQMKDMKEDHRDHSMSSVNKIQSNRSYKRAQEFEHDRFQQGYRNDRNMATKADFCSYCGFDHDEERRCPAYGKQFCRAEKRNQERYDSPQQSRSVNYRNRRNVKKTTEDTNETDSNTDKSDYEEDENYFGETTKHIMKIHKVKTIYGTTDIKKKTVTVRIDDVDVKVEPDSGADMNVMDENQFLKFQKRTYGNPVLERSTVKLRTLQNSLPIKGEFKTVIRNETCGTETKFIVVKGEIKSPPLISKSTLIELGMLQIRADGSFTKPNHLTILDKEKDVMIVTEQDRGKIKHIKITEQKENLRKKESVTATQEMFIGNRSTPATRRSRYKALINRPIRTQ